MASDTKKDYEVHHRIRLGDGILVRPASEELTIPGEEPEIKTISLTQEEAQPFLATGAIRPVPTRRQAQRTAEDEEPEGPVAPVSPAPPAPPVEAASLADVFDADLASTLEAGGYTSVDQVQSASDEELSKIEGFGKKSLEKVRAALGQREA